MSVEPHPARQGFGNSDEPGGGDGDDEYYAAVMHNGKEVTFKSGDSELRMSGFPPEALKLQRGKGV